MIKSCKNPQKTVYMIFGLQRSCGGINEPLQAQRTRSEELEREGYAFKNGLYDIWVANELWGN
jgi:hypothetical protein